MATQAQTVAKQAIDRLLRRKDYKEDKEARSPQNSLGGDEELPFFGQTRPRSQSHPPTGGVSGLSFTSQRPTLLPTITRSSTGGSASLQSPRPNRTLLFIGVAAACLSMLACLYMLFSRPVHSAPGDLAEPTEPNTIDKVTIRAWTANTTASATLDETAPRVALCFFGLSRSLKFTLASIEDNILRPLRESGYRPTVFLHTYKDAVSADEQSKQTQADEWKLLNPFQSVVTSQEEFLQTHSSAMNECWKHGTGWVAAPLQAQQKNLRNLLCQLNSLKEVGQLWQTQFDAHPDEYAAVAFVRPDVLYRDPFPVHLIPRFTEEKNDVYVPAWGSYSGINDRFALLSPSGAAAWKGRMDYTLQQCLVEPIHAELFAQNFALSSGFKVKKLHEFVFFRVRSDGAIAAGDHILPGLNTIRLDIKDRLRVLKGFHKQQQASYLALHSRKASVENI